MVHHFDLAVLTFLNRFVRHSWTFDLTAVFITYSNLAKGGLFALLIWWLWFRSAGKEETRRRHILLGSIVAAFLALIVARAMAVGLPFRLRPAHTPGLDFILPYGMKATALEGWSAFPSDHAALFAAMATGVITISRKLGLAVAAYVLVGICLPRLYLGLHYPTDVIAGLVIGAGLGLGVQLASKWTSLLIEPLVRLSQERPAIFYVGFFFVTYQISTLFQESRDLGNFLLRLMDGFTHSYQPPQ
jgi:undecaprenyl-diphosphatase